MDYIKAAGGGVRRVSPSAETGSEYSVGARDEGSPYELALADMLLSCRGKSTAEIQEMCKNRKDLLEGMIGEIKTTGHSSGNGEQDAIKMAQKVTELVESFLTDHRYFYGNLPGES
jgi:hypothetical protein